MESPPDGSVPAAQDVSALEFGAVVTRRGVTEYLMGFLEDGSVVTWRRVPKSLMALKRRFCRCVPKALLGSPEVWLRRHVGRGPAVSDGSSGRRFFPRLRGNLRAVLFLFSSFVSLVLVNGCTLWPQPGASGSVVIVAAATGPMTGMNTLTNSPSVPHLKAFRVDLRCSGESMKSQLRSAERENWLKPVTVQRALRARRQRHACNPRKVAPEIRVGVLNVQGMSWTKRSYRGMLWHMVTKNEGAERRCDVRVRWVHVRVDEQR